MSTKTLTFPLHNGGRWSAAFEQRQPVWFDLTQVTPDRLAHGLGLVNRFCGATDRAYSVAEHSWRLAKWVREAVPRSTRTDWLACLVHDCPEAMGVADCNGALKKLIAEPTRDFEARLGEEVWRCLTGLSRVSWRVVWTPLHKYDQAIGNWEARCFGFDNEWNAETGVPLPQKPTCWNAEAASAEWLALWEEWQ